MRSYLAIYSQDDLEPAVTHSSSVVILLMFHIVCGFL